MSFLGLDLGTSGLKALLTNAEGHVIGQAEQNYPVSHPHEGWSEQDLADWIAALHKIVASGAPVAEVIRPPLDTHTVEPLAAHRDAYAAAFARFQAAGHWSYAPD